MLHIYHLINARNITFCYIGKFILSKDSVTVVSTGIYIYTPQPLYNTTTGILSIIHVN